MLKPVKAISPTVPANRNDVLASSLMFPLTHMPNSTPHNNRMVWLLISGRWADSEAAAGVGRFNVCVLVSWPFAK